MERTDVVVIGAGQAGLAASRCLSIRGIDHVVLERGRRAERWRSERWSSLRLLTPNWQSRLPGARYDGPDPDGYMRAADVVTLLERYAAAFDAPVREGARVVRARRLERGYVVATETGTFEARAVVVATGHCDLPYVPPCADDLATDVFQVTPTAYRDPDSLPPGGVLVVGASASGAQLSDELCRSGRHVVLSVGRHARLPRAYGGRDVYAWLDAIGALRERLDESRGAARARRAPSPQLVGSSPERAVDLPALRSRGVRITGRLVGIDGHVASFADDLETTTRAADAKQSELLARIDAHIARRGGCVIPATRPAPFVAAGGPTSIDLREEGIRSVVWATGFRRNYPWLDAEVLDAHGEIRQRRGVAAAPGLYTLGLAFQRHRGSSLLDGVGEDARAITAHLAAFLRSARAAA